MKAIIAEQYGGPEVLKIKNIEQPTPKSNEVLIKIRATSVTASDVLIRALNGPFIYKLIVQLIFGFGKPRNPILGMVVSGTVAGKGKDVTKFNLGDDVFAYCSISPTKHRFGSYAEYICLPQEWNLALKPTNINFKPQSNYTHVDINKFFIRMDYDFLGGTYISYISSLF